MSVTLLEARDLKKHYPIKRPDSFFKHEWLKAVDGISFSVRAGETLGIVGESGCGKSTTRKLLLSVEPATAGAVVYENRNVYEMDKQSLRQFRRDVQMVYQDPYSSLDPKWTVGRIIAEPLAIHKIGTRKSRREKAADLMKLVGLREEYIDKFVHEFSGGQRQRIGIARALALDPKVIVADEPVSALDVSIQAQVINLLMDLKERLNLTYVFISHDLSVVKYICDRVIVMYLGKIVEVARSEEFFREPRHPYSRALLQSVPMPDPDIQLDMQTIIGDIPSPINPPSGCAFHPRCPHAMEICKKTEPELISLEETHHTRCHLYGRERKGGERE